MRDIEWTLSRLEDLADRPGSEAEGVIAREKAMRLAQEHNIPCKFLDREIDVEAKLIALMALAESEANEAEAKLALEAAIRLAAQHGIKLSDLNAKRKEDTVNWFKGGETQFRAYNVSEFAQVDLRQWCAFAEQKGWKRHRRSHHEREGWIYSYRFDSITPKLELRIIDRSWGDVEFEVVRNPDPIIGQYAAWMEQIFDVVAIGVTFYDFRVWVERYGQECSRPAIVAESL